MVGQLEAYGALKLFILSSGRVGSGGVEEKKRKKRKRREGVEEKSGGSECGERWRNGGRVNCVYYKNQYSFFFFFSAYSWNICFFNPASRQDEF